jgi:hypothetical protein
MSADRLCARRPRQVENVRFQFLSLRQPYFADRLSGNLRAFKSRSCRSIRAVRVRTWGHRVAPFPFSKVGFSPTLCTSLGKYGVCSCAKQTLADETRPPISNPFRGSDIIVEFRLWGKMLCSRFGYGKLALDNHACHFAFGDCYDRSHCVFWLSKLQPLEAVEAGREANRHRYRGVIACIRMP